MSESPVAEEVEAKLPRSLLLNLRRVAGTCNIARTRLDASLSCVKRIETIFDLETEIVLEVVRVHKAEAGAQADKSVPTHLFADDCP